MLKEASNPVKSTIRTLEVLEGLRELNGARVTELAAHLDRPRSNVHNYLSTLRQEEYVVKDGDEYRVGLRFFELGAHARNQVMLHELARPEIDELAEETGELTNLLVEEHGRGSYLYRARGEHAVRVAAHVGTRVPLHSTGLGKAILAHLPRDYVEEIIAYHGLPASTPATITDEEELFAELERTRERGYAIDDEERLPGLRCVAAPVLGDAGGVLGAVSIAGPTNRFRGERFEVDLPERLLETVNIIELSGASLQRAP